MLAASAWAVTTGCAFLWNGMGTTLPMIACGIQDGVTFLWNCICITLTSCAAYLTSCSHYLQVAVGWIWCVVGTLLATSAWAIQEGLAFSWNGMGCIFTACFHYLEVAVVHAWGLVVSMLATGAWAIADGGKFLRKSMGTWSIYEGVAFLWNSMVHCLQMGFGFFWKGIGTVLPTILSTMQFCIGYLWNMFLQILEATEPANGIIMLFTVMFLFWTRRSNLSQVRNIVRGYHQTSPTYGKAIVRRGFQCGSSGALGGGIYFALSEADTKGKAHNNGYMLVCDVSVGRTKLVDQWDPSITKSTLKAEGFDSVYITAGQNSSASRPEYVVFSPRQVKMISHRQMY
eukprot:gnl/MRDRNA2_/MRDRNA2_172053_c0_seq1.p1 gnl/MRDRNA2_/MRDRNA2_172053_c0~~gnl/MRDRNA2_/MRDRNA2_172053_c0_seq1.p1  ORF type:complete len:372 (-),score=44.06 gnl/MRDRNA2_/MRDRNA2_172053_c0_seq1:99-1127(-)